MRIFLFVYLFFSALTVEAEEGIFQALFSRYTRPFTCLALGCEEVPSCLANLEAYPASVFVAFQGIKYPKRSKNLIFFNHIPTVQEIERLSECEHVDVVFLKNPISLFGQHAERAIRALQKMAHVLLIECPKYVEPLDGFKKYLENMELKEERRDSVFYLMEQKGPFKLERTSFIHPKKIDRVYEIECDYRLKRLNKNGAGWGRQNEWIPGINLLTYLVFNGHIPSRREVVECLPREGVHADRLPNNMIIQGQNLTLIDWEDPNNFLSSEEEEYQRILLEGKIKRLILTTPGLAPDKVRRAFITIYQVGAYLDQQEVSE